MNVRVSGFEQPLRHGLRARKTDPVSDQQWLPIFITLDEYCP
jgi:hypothetical protein